MICLSSSTSAAAAATAAATLLILGDFYLTLLVLKIVAKSPLLKTFQLLTFFLKLREEEHLSFI